MIYYIKGITVHLPPFVAGCSLDGKHSILEDLFLRVGTGLAQTDKGDI
jgi:hypothetical protein